MSLATFISKSDTETEKLYQGKVQNPVDPALRRSRSGFMLGSWNVDYHFSFIVIHNKLATEDSQYLVG